MPGPISTTSTSPAERRSAHDAVVAVVRSGAESSCGWLWAAVVASSAPQHGFGVTFPAIAVAAAGAALLGWWARTLRRSGRAARAGWFAALVATGLVGAVATAFALVRLGGATLGPAALARPWSLVAPADRFTAGLALGVGALAWGRGLWLGAQLTTTRRVARSTVVGALALGIAVLNASLGVPGFDVGTTATGAATVGFFLCATLALALVHQRDLEQTVLGQVSERPGGVWLSVLAVPLGLVAGASLVVVLVGLLVAGPVADATGAVLSAVRRAVVAVAEGLGGAVNGDEPTTTVAPTAPADPAEAPSRLLLPGVIVTVLVAAAVAVGLWRLVRALRHLPLFQGVSGRGIDVPADRREDLEESSSVFSWGHLLDQLRAWLARCFSRGRRRTEDAPSPVVEGGARPEDPVRRAYYEVLVAARDAGLARTPVETPDELARRLTPELAPGAATALDTLTVSYGLVRYGERPAGAEGAPGGEGAAAAAAIVEASLAADPDGDGAARPGDR